MYESLKIWCQTIQAGYFVEYLSLGTVLSWISPYIQQDYCPTYRVSNKTNVHTSFVVEFRSLDLNWAIKSCLTRNNAHMMIFHCLYLVVSFLFFYFFTIKL